MRLRRQCKHLWKEVALDYHEPQGGVSLKGTWSKDQHVRIKITGWTIVTLCCIQCGELKQKELEGKYSGNSDAEFEKIRRQYAGRQGK